MNNSTLSQNRHTGKEAGTADEYKAAIERILSQAGITLNGDMPWDIRVKDERFYQRVMREGSLGLGESYMDGWWDCDELDTFFAKLVPINPEEKIKADWRLLLHTLGEAIFNPGRKSRAFQIGEMHYDRGNELFSNMLDKRMAYSCAYWKEAKDLDSAQEA